MWAIEVDGPEILVAVRDMRVVEGGGWVDQKKGAVIVVINKIPSGVFALKHWTSSYRILLESWGEIWLVNLG